MRVHATSARPTTYLHLMMLKAAPSTERSFVARLHNQIVVCGSTRLPFTPTSGIWVSELHHAVDHNNGTHPLTKYPVYGDAPLHP